MILCQTLLKAHDSDLARLRPGIQMRQARALGLNTMHTLTLSYTHGFTHSDIHTYALTHMHTHTI